jgi:hypothetical protein
MATRHAKSPCCRGSIYKFGKRRRQCAACKRTWSTRKKKRGRKRKRIARALLDRILLERYTIAQEQKRSRLSKSGIALRYAKAMRLVAANTPFRFPRGPYALIGDGLYFKFRRKEWVMYLMAVKPIRGEKAYFLDPMLFEGRECYERWCQATATIPPAVQKHIVAFVSDGFRGSQTLSEQNGWFHQRCHFHLLANLVRGKGKRRYRVRGSRLRDHLLETSQTMITSKNKDNLKAARSTIRRLISRQTCPPYIRKQTLEFLEREQDFRTYLRYPRLHLPVTTNAIESTGQMVRKATRTARTPTSLLLRATAFLRLKKSIVCNGNHQPN